VNYWETDTPTLLLHVMVTITRIPCTLLVGHGYTSSLDTIISYIDIIVTWMLKTLFSHVHTSLWHMLTTQVYMHVLFLSSCYMTHRAYYTDYCSMLPYQCYMIIFGYWYGYSRYWTCYWTWELLICDMWNSTSIVPVSRYIVAYPCSGVMAYSCSCGSRICSNNVMITGPELCW